MAEKHILLIIFSFFHFILFISACSRTENSSPKPRITILSNDVKDTMENTIRKIPTQYISDRISTQTSNLVPNMFNSLEIPRPIPYPTITFKNTRPDLYNNNQHNNFYPTMQNSRFSRAINDFTELLSGNLNPRDDTIKNRVRRDDKNDDTSSRNGPFTDESSEDLEWLNLLSLLKLGDYEHDQNHDEMEEPFESSEIIDLEGESLCHDTSSTDKESVSLIDRFKEKMPHLYQRLILLQKKIFDSIIDDDDDDDDDDNGNSDNKDISDLITYDIISNKTSVNSQLEKPDKGINEEHQLAEEMPTKKLALRETMKQNAVEIVGAVSVPTISTLEPIKNNSNITSK